VELRNRSADYAGLAIQGPFDIIFADPPYEKTKQGGEFTRLLLENERIAELLAPGGVFVLEKRPGEEIVPPRLWEIIRAKRYGATEVLFLQHADAAVVVAPETE